MPEFAARIGRIRMKAGGADIRVLQSKPGLDGKDDWRGAIVRNARTVAEYGDDDPLVGYVLIGVFKGGGASVGYRYDPDQCPIPRALFPAWVAETIRRDMLVNVEARDVFNEMFEWKD